MVLKKENPLAQELQYWILTRLYLSTLGLSFPWHGLLGQPLGIPEKHYPKVLSKIPNPNSQSLSLSLSLSWVLEKRQWCEEASSSCVLLLLLSM